MDILKRTAFCEAVNKGGTTYHRFYDWTRVETDLGTMFEGGQVNQRTRFGDGDLVATDYESDDHMINEIEFVNFDKIPQTVGYGLIGGTLLPRSGR